MYFIFNIPEDSPKDTRGKAFTDHAAEVFTSHKA